jgi:hypothetical protein
MKAEQRHLASKRLSAKRERTGCTGRRNCVSDHRSSTSGFPILTARCFLSPAAQPTSRLQSCQPPPACPVSPAFAHTSHPTLPRSLRRSRSHHSASPLPHASPGLLGQGWIGRWVKDRWGGSGWPVWTHSCRQTGTPQENLARHQQSAHLDGEIAGIIDNRLNLRRLSGRKAAAAPTEARVCQKPGKGHSQRQTEQCQWLLSGHPAVTRPDAVRAEPVRLTEPPAALHRRSASAAPDLLGQRLGHATPILPGRDSHTERLVPPKLEFPSTMGTDGAGWVRQRRLKLPAKHRECRAQDCPCKSGDISGRQGCSATPFCLSKTKLASHSTRIKFSVDL